MSAFRVLRRLRDLLDVDTTGATVGDALVLDADGETWVPGAGGGGGAPTDADYLVGTANGSLSAEIVVGTSPGGELGGTWASPTVDATHSGSSHASVQAAAEATAASALATHSADTTAVHGITDTAALLTTTAADAAYQPKDSDLTAIAALTTTSFGRALLELANQAALLSAAGAAAASHVHAGEDITSGTVADARIASTIARDSEVTSAISALSSVYQPLDSDLTAIAALTTTSFGRSLLALADAAALLSAAGAAAAVHTHAAGDITSGTMAQARLGSGSGGAGTKVLYDDQTYKTPSGGGSATTTAVAQVAHGLAVGDVVKLSGSNTYAKAQANSAANAEVVGIVSAVADADNFTLTTGGEISGLSGLTANTVYYLSPSSAGALTATEPSTVGQVSKPILNAKTTTTGYVFNMRGATVTAAATSSVVRSTRSSNTILAGADRGTLIAATAAYTQTLTAAATLTSGWWVYIKNESATALLTLDPNSTETIDGVTTKVLLPGQMILVECDGSNFTSQVLADPYEWTVVYKAADESVTSSTTVQVDDELKFTATSGSIYEIEMFIVYVSAAGGGTPDFKYQLYEDATARGAWSAFATENFSAADTATGGTALTGSGATPASAGTATTNRVVRLQSWHVGGGGTFALYWAQNTSDANATTVKAGSVLRYRRIL